MQLKKIDDYFKSNVYKPFLMAVGDNEYRYYKAKLTELGNVEFVRLSKCCTNNDKKPDLDKLREILRMADIDFSSNKIVLLGLGEYLALEGTSFARKILNELISFNLGSAHVLFLLRGVNNVVKEMLANDPRYESRQIAVGEDSNSTLSFMFSSLELGIYDVSGIQKVLEKVEDGTEQRIYANTSIKFPDSIFQVQNVNTSYEAICKKLHHFSFPKKNGSDSDWDELLKDVNDCLTLDKVFKKHGFEDYSVNLYSRIAGTEYENWLYYLYLNTIESEINRPYLQYVIKNSDGFEVFKHNILNAIINIPHTVDNFVAIYEDRKRIVAQYPNAEIAKFVSDNRYDPKESIYKLTDNSLVEREEIIAEISQNGIPDCLDRIYPALSSYLKKYYFQGDAISELLTEYFEDYKRQKVLNYLDKDFLDKVDKLATERVYNRLRTRDEIIASIDKKDTYLRWIDALGVEYLSFIVEKAKERGLAVSVCIGRSDLPTITKINKEFYDSWPDERKSKIEDLDDVKHTEKGGYKYSPSTKYPIHLAKELDIISKAIDEAAVDLGLRQYDKYIIASDHGASRLAVLREKEEKYDTDTQGEHSGRCCKHFDGYDLPFATEDNGYIVLADYGRFKGSRAANVEVHGGASLEEVIVPIVTLSLKDNSIEIKLVENTVKADYKNGVSITLFVNKVISQNLCVEYKGIKYQGTIVDSTHYKVDISEIKRAGTFPADVYIGNDLITHVEIKAIGKSGSVNSDFDDLL